MPVQMLSPISPALPRIALVGAGPTSAYTLAALIDAPVALDITIFEQGRQMGPGMPYNAAMNDPAMLSNIASRELPPLIDSLHGWLSDLPVDQLAALHLAADPQDEDAFHPRVVIGAWFTAQMAELIAQGRRRGHRIEARLRHRVTDVSPQPEGIRLHWDSPDRSDSALFDEVVLATGHVWPDRSEDGADEVPLLSPWPAEKIARLPHDGIGVLGSSLSAIDVAVAIASARGIFSDDQTVYTAAPRPGADPLHITLISRKGLLPEADYWYDLPLPDLPRLAALTKGANVNLDAAYAAFTADLAEADATYAATLGLPLPLTNFAAAYYAPRLGADPFDHAARNLTEAEATLESRRATPWRSALLRAHELFEDILPRLTEADLDRFHATLRPVFADCYACVPHTSIRRLLALHRAGHLDVVATGADAALRSEGQEITLDTTPPRRFDAVIDARGQRAHGLGTLGFPALTNSRLKAPLRFETYILPLAEQTRGRVHCLALPVLLRRHPFVQGLVNAHDMANATAQAILARQAPPLAAE
ncbi:FAD/NAD(P)-binding protein [Sagittula sp. S175]|uniref:FAD/NAD(P)-binding protein n=1 Tax=Sagittula sp. S175 TaxID=3415129 RepID=UPI003C7C4B4A